MRVESAFLLCPSGSATGLNVSPMGVWSCVPLTHSHSTIIPERGKKNSDMHIRRRRSQESQYGNESMMSWLSFALNRCEQVLSSGAHLGDSHCVNHDL